MLSKKSTCIIDIINGKYKDDLINLLNKILKNINISEQEFLNIIHDKNNNTDEKIIKCFTKLNKNQQIGYSEESDKYRAYGKWKNIKFDIPKPTKSILDFGGNVGNTAMILGRQILKLSKENTLCVDIDTWAEENWKPRDDITWYHTNDLNKIESNSISLITCFHTFHHIPNNLYEGIITHLYRILNSNGILVLYEHDAPSIEWSQIIDLEHILYDVTLSKKMTYSKFLKMHYAKYLNIKEWMTLFKKYNFKIIKTKKIKSLDNSFYLFIRKF